MKKVRLFLLNGALLTLVTLFMRTVGVAFNAYVSGRIGETGMGLLTLTMSVYTFAVTFATSGINLAAMRLTAESMAGNNAGAVRCAMRRCIVYSLIFGLTAGVLLFSGADLVGGVLLSDMRTVPSLRLLSVSLPFIALSSAMHGYFTAVRRVIKSAAAQVFEQFVKILLTSAGLSLLLPRGLAYSCMAVVGGASIAELASFFFTYIMYRFDLKKHIRAPASHDGKMTGRMLKIALPTAAAAYVRSGLLTVEHLLIPYGLRKRGASVDRALATYGVLSGMVFPVVLFPQAFVSAFAGLLVPELAECRARNNEIRITRIITRVLKLTAVFSVGVAGIMLSFSHELGQDIYGSAEASLFIKIMAPLIPVMYLDSTVDCMLKGLGEQLYSMRVNIVDSLLSVIMVFFLVPVLGIYGYVITVFVCELINTALSLTRLLLVADFKIDIIAVLLKPLLCIIGATTAVKLFFIVIPQYAPTAAKIAAAAVLYLTMLMACSGFAREDIKFG